MTGKERFKSLVDEGRKGNNVGMTIGSYKLEAYMDGYLPGVSYLIGGASGTGKSTYALWALVYKPLLAFINGENTNRDPYWIMFSLEMTQEQVYAKLVSMYIYDVYGIQLKFKEMFSRGKDCILSDEHRDLIDEVDSFLDVLDERLYFKEGVLTEGVYIETLDEQLKRFGKFDGDSYIPNNPNQVVGVMIDHCSLVKATGGRSKKDEMDAISRDSVIYRNKTRIMSPIHISQFNRASNSDERLKQSMQAPTQADFKDSGSLYEDSQVVLAIFSPQKYRLKTHHNYDVSILEQILISVYLLKSRFGNSDVAVDFGFYGDCSHYLQLPSADQIYDYSAYLNPDWYEEVEINKQDKQDCIDEKVENNKIEFYV